MTLLFFTVVISLFLSSSAQSCNKYSFASNKIFKSCNELAYLNSYLHWTYNPSLETVQIAYRHAGIKPTRWVAFAINPTAKGMAGSQALIAFQKSDGTMRVYATPITSYQTQLKEGELSFPLTDLSATYSNEEYIIFATLKLQNMSNTVNQVWQEGPVSGDVPGIHDTYGPNVQSMGTLNLLSGESGTAGGDPKTRKRNIHGVLNVVSWGIMMPIGALFPRYLKVFKAADPTWFYLHASCQTSAYIIGVVGWAIGLQLGSESSGVQYTPHRTLGIVLFCLGTLQVFALLLRPKKDNKYRFYWNIYHHSVGYTVIILSIINIIKGFNILNPQKKWERAYIGIIIGLGILAVTLELYTWQIILKRKKSTNIEKMSQGMNGTNGYGGGRARDRV